MGIDRDDAKEIVRTVYAEYLAETFNKDWRGQLEATRYLNQFDQDQPRWQDAKALANATDACLAAASIPEAHRKSHDAFWEEKFRHEYIQKNAPPNQRASADWHERGTSVALEQVRTRNEKTMPPPELGHDLETAAVDQSPEKPLIDHVLGENKTLVAQETLSQRAPELHPDDAALAAKIQSSQLNNEPNGLSDQDLKGHVLGSAPLSLPTPRSNRNDYTRYQKLGR